MDNEITDIKLTKKPYEDIKSEMVFKEVIRCRKCNKLKDKSLEEHCKCWHPLAYKNAKDLQDAMELYFNDCRDRQAPYTITWLACAVWLDRERLINYGNKEEFADIVKKAKQFILSSYEERAMLWKSNPVFTMFSLKNNFGWKDKSEVEQIVNHTFNLLELHQKSEWTRQESQVLDWDNP